MLSAAMTIFQFKINVNQHIYLYFVLLYMYIHDDFIKESHCKGGNKNDDM
jgi:hypothetical protein